MNKLSVEKLVSTVIKLRKAQGLTQVQLAEKVGMNRAMIGIVYPPSHVLLILFLSFSIAHAIISARKLSDFISHFSYRLRMYSKSKLSLVPIKAISKVFYFADMSHSRFLPIHFQKKFSFYDWYDIFQGS